MGLAKEDTNGNPQVEPSVTSWGEISGARKDSPRFAAHSVTANSFH